MSLSILEIVVFCCAVVGFPCALVGRFMVWSAAWRVGVSWFLVVFILPGGDLIFLARHWKRASRGVFTTITGVGLFLPAFVWGMMHLEQTDIRQRVARIKSVSELTAMDRERLAGLLREDADKRIKTLSTIGCRLYPRLVEWQKNLSARQQKIGTADTLAGRLLRVEVESYRALATYLRELREEEALLKGLPWLSAANIPDEELLRLAARLRLSQAPEDSDAEEDTLRGGE